MLKTMLLFLALLVPMQAGAQEPMPKLPAPAEEVILPALPVNPAPKPAPGAPVLLNMDSLYVVRSNAACVLVASPEGVVKITQYAGPLPIITQLVGERMVKVPSLISPGKFVDDGPAERTFQEKNIWIIRAVKQGTAELIVVPTGGAILRRTLVVGTPEPPVPPDPPQPTDPLAVSLQAALAKELPADRSKLGVLAAHYRLSAALANDPTITTAGQLHDIMKTARRNTLLADGTQFGDSLPNVMAVITAELNSLLPTMVTAPLDAPTRAKCAQAFTRIGTLVGGLK